MTPYGLIILSLIILLHFISGQASSDTGPKTQLAHNSFVERSAGDADVTTNLRSWRGRRTPHHRHLRNAHGILKIIGWGTLLPLGVIIARYFRNFPMQWNEWYPFHVMCQSFGYALGTIGWLIGILAGLASPKQLHAEKSSRILSIIIFTLTTIQMIALVWQPKKDENEEYYYRKGWEICHHFLGYVIIALIIADIFQGIKDQSHATKWKWIYVGILGVLGLVTVSLEILRWVRYKIFHETIQLTSYMYSSSP